MPIKASEKSAALAGAWTSSGMVPLEGWLDHQHAMSSLESNLLWLFGAAVFFLIPVYIFVIGLGTGRFSLDWFLNSEERARYWVVARRMFVWFVSAGAVGAVWSITIGLITSKSS